MMKLVFIFPVGGYRETGLHHPFYFGGGPCKEAYPTRSNILALHSKQQSEETTPSRDVH